MSTVDRAAVVRTDQGLRIGRRDIGVLGIHVLLALVFAYRTLAHLTTQFAGYPGDSAQFGWGLVYTAWALLHGHSPLLSDRVIAPAGVNLMWNTTTPLLGVVATPVSVLGGPVVAYNATLIAVIATNGFVTYLALARFAPDRIARLVGSAYFAYSGYLVPHANGHLNLTAVFLVPVLLVLLHELLVGRTWPSLRLGIALGLTLAAQLLISEELLATEAIAAITGALVLALVNVRSLSGAYLRMLFRQIWRPVLIALTLFSVVAIYPLYVQFFGPRRITGGIAHPQGVYVGDLRGLVQPTAQQITGPALGFSPPNFTGREAEWNGYIGLPLLVVLAITVICLWRRPAIRWAIGFCLAMTVLSFGPTLHINGISYGPPLPWVLVARLPLMANLVPARLALYADLAVAFTIAILAAQVRRLPSLRVRSVVLVAAVPVALSLLPIALATTPATTPKFFTSAALRREVPLNSNVLVLPFSAEGTGTTDDVSALVWQAQSRMWFRMEDGYWLVPSPTGTPQIGPNRTALVTALLGAQDGRPATMTPALRSSALAQLRGDKVERVLLGPTRYQTRLRYLLETLLGPPDASIDGVVVWRPQHWAQ